MTSAPSDQFNRPNILLITSDQQHWNTLGKHLPEIKTPHLDRLAASGMLCTRAYCPNPTCTPTRASLVTGQYPSRHGAWSLGTKLMESSTTIGELLSKEGYDTALVGKAHFQPLRETKEWSSLESYPKLRDTNFWKSFHGPFYGFDHVEIARNHGDEAHAGQHYGLWMESKGFTNWRDHFENTWGEFDFTDGGPVRRGQHGAWTLPEEFHMNTWITERSSALMDESLARKKPFFIWASYFDPHPPYLVPEPWASLYDPAKITVPQITPGEHDDSPDYIRATQTEHPDFSAFDDAGQPNHGLHSHLEPCEVTARNIALYYGMISMMDHSIGRLLDHLEAIGEKDNTLVVFTSDHGHFYGQHGLAAKGPFHYEDGIRVPCIVSWPGQIPANVESSALQSLVDLPVTFLKAAGLPVPGAMQGVDQLPVWRGEQPAARDHLLVEFRHQPSSLHMKTLVEDRYKITLHYRRPYGELYDLKEDPGELHNLWDRPECATLKSDLLRRYIDAELEAEPMPMPRIAGA